MNHRLINLEAILREEIESWARNNIPDVLALDRQVKALRASGHHTTNGLTAEKTMLHKGEVPVKLSVEIAKRTHKDWLLDPEIRNLFFALFRVGCVNRLSESKK